MHEELARWEARYCQSGRVLHQPDDFLQEHWRWLRGPRLLDVAMGEGRNAIYLARCGFEVTGVDFSPAGVNAALRWARAENLHIAALVCDLSELQIPGAPYDSIVVTRYWQPSLCKVICRALKPGGTLLYETYLRSMQRYPGRAQSADPRHFPQPGELRRAFAELIVEHYSEVDKPASGEVCARLLARQREQ